MTDKEYQEDIYCIGCGAVLQSDDENKLGYVPQAALSKAEEEAVYCKRCFRLRHYNEVQDIELSDDDFLNMLHELSSQDALIVNMVDIFDFNGSVISGIQRFAGNNPLVIVGNKVDLLPKSLKQSKMRQWITEQCHLVGLRPQSVYLISALNKDSVSELMQSLEKERRGKDVYIVGTTNVGKSTLVNQIISIATDEDNTVTTSYFPGTTLGKIEIPLDDEKVLVDTPGIIQPAQLSYYLPPKDIKAVTPRKEIKPKSYQLNEGQTVFLAGLARFDYLKGEGKQSFVLYAANDLYIHRTKTEKADELYNTQKGALLNPPSHPDSLPELKRYEFTLNEPSDIVFSGLGWVSVENAGTKVAAWAPKGVDVVVRKKLI
ncbi:GTP-binding protein YqeH, required for biogenesis of 30S ribosome subunit [Alkalibacterium sp. AK22]|uniref:ribosome biogenesis GTPase YqeH n=1 Tax=Alkalibacterium sp. AK22 TaxID=1229520 RepID=UPI0004499F7B|nr:ribosome biogenesis GTPase YqeH [Alkalibacterium sp. AK22]EXJ22870.1 GTP-binding protein YqeH, required for biogenesis of 30S ribosome subunit [Alkalibacterium sp. AK22]